VSRQEGMKLEGRVVVVTGGAHGIGEATAYRFAEEGAKVVIADLDLDGAQVVAKACGEQGVDTLAVAFDQRSSASVDEMVATAEQHFGRIDVLANVAGIYPPSLIVETSDERWDDVLRNNLTGVFYCCRAVLPGMLERGGGAIVSVSSGSAVKPLEGFAAYSASKGGLAAFSRVLALEAAPLVRVNVVAPGPTLTHGIRAGAMAEDTEDANPTPAPAPDPDPAATGERARIDASLLLDRWGQPPEIAEMIVFLSSDRASFVTGQMIHVNGGRSMV
jgi:NAD(P)-dependent dehydrogenase (short-subunit alcohol dehydrogenase family)